LTRRANQAHIHIVAKIIEPAPQLRQRVFHFCAAMFARSVSICPIGFAAFSLKFDTSGKSDAHWHHRPNDVRPATEPAAAGLFICPRMDDCYAIGWRSEKSLTRRANHRHIAIIEMNANGPRGEIRCGLFV
jgi:hypothetical protein